MNFALIMFLALALTGAVWLCDGLWLARQRKFGRAEPWWVEYSKSFFPVILVVFVLRSFVVEPFKIPSGSMIPTLLVGDYILVNKYTYGIRLPVVNVKLLEVGSPRRGEVMVFRYPADPSLDYIKRVVGLPGDKISYQNKKLAVNGQELRVENDGAYNYVERGFNYVLTNRYQENLDGHRHPIIVIPGTPEIRLHDVRNFPFHDNCVYNEQGFDCTVPPGHFFMMGDNRDGSSDSRYWGFVPEQNIVGKAFMVWWNLDEFRRIGTFIN